MLVPHLYVDNCVESVYNSLYWMIFQFHLCHLIGLLLQTERLPKLAFFNLSLTVQGFYAKMSEYKKAGTVPRPHPKHLRKGQHG